MAKAKSHKGKVVENAELYETTEYGVFVLDHKNRPINEGKVHSFMKDFKTGKFFMKEFPAIVDDNFVVLDGQHRYEACRRLSLPFFFRFSHELTLYNVVDVQVNAGWTTNDYLHAFVKQDKMDYIILQRFVKRYNMPVSLAVLVLEGRRLSLGKAGFYDGTFLIKNEEKGHKRAQVIQDVGALTKRLHKDKAFGLAMIDIMNSPEYDHERMMEQMGKYHTLMQRHVNTENYIRNLEEVYNYRLQGKNKVRFN